VHRRIALVVGMTGAAVLLLAVAATAGPGTVWRDVDIGTPTPDTLPLQTLPPVGPGGQADVPDLRWVLFGLALLSGVMLFVAFIWGLSRVRWRRPPRRRVLTPLPEVAPDELLEAADDFSDLILRGSARNAIVACWVRLETAVEQAGLVRDPAETAAEMTRRVLRAYAVDAGSIEALAALYREARFSSHDMSEEHRRHAQRALGEIRRQLRAAVDRVAAGSER
jgi:hypothetical protein